MLQSSVIKKILVEIISLFCILLFVYAAVSKVLEFENFQAQLGQSTILSAYAGLVSYCVIIIEFLISIMLAIPSLRIRGLFGAFTLMSIFTIYIFIILNFSSNVPCSCGGILEKMTWKTHLLFNVIVLVLISVALLIKSMRKLKSVKFLLLIFFSAAILLFIVNSTSQYLIHKENPFIRKFVHLSAKKINSVRLSNSSPYFAGSSGGIIYIADRRAPLHIFAYDSLLKIKGHFKIALERDDFNFRSVQVKIQGEYFFVFDGSIPLVYRGKISDWKAEIIMQKEGYYFSKAVIIDSIHIAFRTQNEKSGENELGIFSFMNGLNSRIHKELLQKQVDGFFDTDGMMNYSAESKIFSYLYYYRNEFIVTNEKLQIKYRGNTIDTTKKAKVKPIYIEEIGRRKLASPDLVVNRISASRDNHLFVNSTLRGRFETKEMWNIASIIDIYDLSSKSYLSSFYIYNEGNKKMKDLLVDGNSVYAIVGGKLHRYILAKSLKIKP